MVESAWAEDMRQFLYHQDPNTRKITRSFEKIKWKIINCIPKLGWIYIYIYIEREREREKLKNEVTHS